MTDKNDNQSPKEPSESPDIGRSTNDLRSAAEEALRMMRDSQKSLADETHAEAPQDERPADIGNTTHDLARAAYEAMNMSQSTSDASTVDAVKAFSRDMLLRLNMVEANDSLTVTVIGETIVGRADNVTDYTPEIDLTPHGAYRLGLSRRHAAFVRDNDILYVKDLRSRNGTFVNGVAIEKGGKHVVNDGDEIRFGNLMVRVAFQAKE